MDDAQLIEALETAAKAWSMEQYVRYSPHPASPLGARAAPPPPEHSIMWAAAQRLRALTEGHHQDTHK